jgi:Egh16-like virulence factor
MHFKLTTVALATLVAQVYSHGLVTSIQGSNGVVMPGLGTIDGTPRDCST